MGCCLVVKRGGPKEILVSAQTMWSPLAPWASSRAPPTLLVPTWCSLHGWPSISHPTRLYRTPRQWMREGNTSKPKRQNAPNTIEVYVSLTRSPPWVLPMSERFSPAMIPGPKLLPSREPPFPPRGLQACVHQAHGRGRRAVERNSVTRPLLPAKEAGGYGLATCLGLLTAVWFLPLVGADFLPGILGLLGKALQRTQPGCCCWHRATGASHCLSCRPPPDGHSVPHAGEAGALR